MEENFLIRRHMYCVGVMIRKVSWNASFTIMFRTRRATVEQFSGIKSNQSHLRIR
jgi:hypothetical protein